MLEVAPNCNLIPGGSGIYELQKLSVAEKYLIINSVSELDDQYDFMLIDTAPGIDDNVLYLNSAAQNRIIVLTPEPASLTDAYALIKVLVTRQKENNFSVVCNMVRNEAEAERLFARLSDVVQQFLYVSLNYAGWIPNDPDLRKATKSQQLVVRDVPRSPSSFAIQRLSEKLSRSRHIGQPRGGIQFFWEQLVSVAS